MMQLTLRLQTRPPQLGPCHSGNAAMQRCSKLHIELSYYEPARAIELSYYALLISRDNSAQRVALWLLGPSELLLGSPQGLGGSELVQNLRSSHPQNSDRQRMHDCSKVVDASTLG